SFVGLSRTSYYREAHEPRVLNISHQGFVSDHAPLTLWRALGRRHWETLCGLRGDLRTVLHSGKYSIVKRQYRARRLRNDLVGLVILHGPPRKIVREAHDDPIRHACLRRVQDLWHNLTVLSDHLRTWSQGRAEGFQCSLISRGNFVCIESCCTGRVDQMKED